MTGLCDKHPQPRVRVSRLFLVVVGLVAVLTGGSGGAQSQQQKAPADEQDAIRLNVTLIQVPAVAVSPRGMFIADLSKSEFSILEDGKRQEISVFASVQQPFTAILVLDTSNSAEDRLTAIKRAAIAFVREIRPEDRLMVLSFDNDLRELTEFTSDRGALEPAIKGAESGFGKLLYEAVGRALERLRDASGRKAVILFSDGVDMKSIAATAESATRMAEEVGAVIYVVQFDTRWWVEADARARQSKKSNQNLPFNVDGRIPLPPDYGGPDSTPTGMPKVKPPRIEVGTPSAPPVTVIDGNAGGRRPPAAPRDEITEALDKLYGDADSFLSLIAARTGGRVLRAETFDGTRSAFARIADELRNQYLLGYYASASRADGQYHRIKVESSRKGVLIRARSGYRIPPR